MVIQVHSDTFCDGGSQISVRPNNWRHEDIILSHLKTWFFGFFYNAASILYTYMEIKYLYIHIKQIIFSIWSGRISFINTSLLLIQIKNKCKNSKFYCYKWIMILQHFLTQPLFIFWQIIKCTNIFKVLIKWNHTVKLLEEHVFNAIKTTKWKEN